MMLPFDKEEYDRRWQRVVCRLARNRCQIERPGCSGYALNGAHHIKGRRHFIARWDWRNGIAVCPLCHRWAETHPNDFLMWLYEHKHDQSRALEVIHKRTINPTQEELNAILRELNYLYDSNGTPKNYAPSECQDYAAYVHPEISDGNAEDQ